MYVYIVASRIPYGMRGLKYTTYGMAMRNKKSHPIRDAWIEILQQWISQTQGKCRIPYGMRGLKSGTDHLACPDLARRIPYGMRGLKYDNRVRPDLHYRSYPIWDTCIEMVRF